MQRVARLLVVEDNMGDVELLRDALTRGGHAYELDVVPDGQAAIERMTEICDNGATPPDLVILDLNIPRRDGRSVLAYRRSREELLAIPVIVFSSSNAVRDVRECYVLGANCYVRKPADLQSFRDVVRQIEAFWLETACIPGPE